MSITFNVNRPRTQIGHAVGCYAYGSDANWRGPVAENVEEAVLDHDLSHIGNDECDTPDANIHCYPVYDTDGDMNVHMSNTNAIRVLELLGYNSENSDMYIGSCDAEDFAGRVMLALALTPEDAGVPATTTVLNNGPTFIDGGRSAGYLQHRLEQLSELAALARTHNAPISWG